MNGDPVERHADEKAADQDRRQSEIGRDAERAGQQIEREHAGDDHRAMGQVDDVHDAPDQRQAHGGESVDQPHQHAVDDRSEDAEHTDLGRTRPAAIAAGLLAADYWLAEIG